MYLLLHFLSYRKGKREGIPQRRSWGMVDGALTPWLINVAHIDLAVINMAAINATRVNAAGHRCGCHRCGYHQCSSRRHGWHGCGAVDVGSANVAAGGQGGSRHPAPCFASTLLLVPPPCPISSSSSSSCVPSTLGYVAGVDVVALTCPGRNRRGVADVDMVCGMWSTGSVVDVAWSTGMVMNTHIPQHKGRGKDAVALRLRVVVGGMWN